MHSIYRTSLEQTQHTGKYFRSLYYYYLRSLLLLGVRAGLLNGRAAGCLTNKSCSLWIGAKRFNRVQPARLKGNISC